VCLAAVVLASVLIGLLAVEMAPIAWLGFVVAGLLVAGIAAAVAPRSNRRLRAMPADGAERLLVVADRHCGSPALWQEIHARLADAVAVHLVVSTRTPRLPNDERTEFSAAAARVALAIDLLRQRGVAVTGAVGSDTALASMTDALAAFPATRVLLAASTKEDSDWLEWDLLSKRPALIELPVTCIVVPPTRPPH
jgi:hypothetical protein